MCVYIYATETCIQSHTYIYIKIYKSREIYIFFFLTNQCSHFKVAFDT